MPDQATRDFQQCSLAAAASERGQEKYHPSLISCGKSSVHHDTPFI